MGQQRSRKSLKSLLNTQAERVPFPFQQKKLTTAKISSIIAPNSMAISSESATLRPRRAFSKLTRQSRNPAERLAASATPTQVAQASSTSVMNQMSQKPVQEPAAGSNR